MGQTSQSGQVIFATQTAAGTPVSAGDLATDGLAVKLRSGSLAGNRDLLIPDPEIGGGRDVSDAYGGAVAFSGDFEMYLRFRAIAMFLANALGESATAAQGTNAWTHTITPTDGQTPMMTVYEEIGDALERFIYSDVVVNTLHLESDANGYVMATAGLIGRLATAGVADIDGIPLTDNTNMAVGTNVTVQYNSVTMPAKSFSLDINNNFEDDNFYLGSFFLGDLTAKRREVTASVTVRHETSAYMKQALFGTAGATQIGGLITKQPLHIVIQSYEDIPTSSPLVKFKLDITIPKAAFEPFAFAPSGDDAFENDIAIRAIRPDPALPIMTALVTNDQDSIN